jgi:hypothetical protein
MARWKPNWILAAIVLLIASPNPVERVRATDRYSASSCLAQIAHEQVPEQSVKRALQTEYPQERVASVPCERPFVSRLDDQSLFQRPPPTSL